MPRIRNRRSVGSVSLLFLAVIVPLLLVLLCLGAELTHFFGVHDDMQRIVDRATRASLTKGFSEAETERMLRQELAALSALVELNSVKHSKGARVTDTQVEGTFRGVFSELAARLSGSQMPLLPVRVSARVRKVDARALVVVDRTVAPGAAPCGDAGLEAVSSFVDSIAAELLRAGVSGVSVAVVPGAEAPVDLVSLEPGDDLFVRCREREPGGAPFDVSSIAGSRAVLSADAVAAEVLNIAHSELFAGTAEARSLVFVGQAVNESAHGYASAAFAALNTDMQQRSVLVSGTHVTLGGAGTAPIGLVRQGEFGVELRTVRASPSQIGHPNLMAALRGRVGDRTVLVF